MPLEYYEVALCERFGWTLDYVRGLSMQDANMVLAVLDGMQRAAHPRGKD